MKQKLLKTMLLLCTLLVGGVSSAWATDPVTLASWTFTSESKPANNTDFKATGGSCTNSTFNLNGSGSTWNSTKGYAFTAVTDIIITLKTTVALPAGTEISFSADTYYNKASNAPMTGFTLTASENGGSYATTGLDVTSLSLSNSSATKTCVYTLQSALAVNGTVAIKYTQTGKAGAGQGYFNNIAIIYTPAAPSGTTAAPTISGNTPFLDNTTVTINNAASADGADIYYTLNGDDPTTTTSGTCFAYSAPFQVSATTTVKAIAKKSTDTNASSVVNKTFTKVTPMTVSDALTAISALASNGTIAEQCVSGVVCTAGSLSSGAITYYISADGTESSRLQVYKGKGLNNADFEAAGDIALGDEVVVFGTLKNFNGTTPEFDAGSYLLSKVRKPAPTFSLDISEKSLEAYGNETVDVTLTTNTDGTITCESDDEDVATVALKSGKVYTITAVSEGSATITIRSVASANYSAASATVDITVTDSRDDAGISFAEDAESTTWGESYTGQVLTNTNGVDVEWSSTNEAVATVNSSGVVTVLKAGSTTIKATFAGNATYKAAVASYTLTVNKANAGLSYSKTSFDIRLNDDTFEAPTLINPNGLTVTYTSNNTDVATVNSSTGELSYVATAEGTAKITATFTANDWYKGGSANYTINIIDPTVKGCRFNPYTVSEVRAVSTSTTISDVFVEGYIVGYVNSTYGFTRTTSSFANSNWCIADDKDEDDVDATAPVQISGSTVQATYGLSNHKDLVGAKILIKGDITKYFNVSGVKNLDEINAVKEVKLNGNGYATYASTNALDFSDDSEFAAWQISAANSSTGVITFSQIEGAVAAGTGVLLKGTASSTINIPVAASGTDISSTNKLEGITAATAVDDDTYYGLSGNTFKKVNAGTVPAGKALLPASVVSAGVKAFTFVFENDNETSINSLTPTISGGDGAVYDLSGRRVQKPTKGLYIVNGKKVLF
jgi:uncharacterized protein YjdB